MDPDVFICSNGALIADRDQNILTAHWIPFDRACALIEYLKQSDFESFTFCNGEDSGYHVNEHIVQSPRSLERREKFFAKTIGEAEVLAKGRMISLAAWISDRGRMAEMQAEIQESSATQWKAISTAERWISLPGACRSRPASSGRLPG